MLDSLPYRNDAAIVLRRLMRSLPTRTGVLGVATCDKGLPAMMMALASSGSYPSVLIPGGVTLLPENGEDAGKVQTIGARFAQHQITLEYAAEIGCRACATPGGGCQFLGTAATSQVIAEALGLALPHSALGPSGQPIWLDAARRSARAILRMKQLHLGTSRHPHRRLRQQRHGRPRSLRRIHESPPPPSRHRPRRKTTPPHRPPIGLTSIARFPASSTRSPTAPATTPPSRSSSPEAHPRSCSISAAPAFSTPPSKPSPARPSTPHLDWWQDSPRRHTLRKNLLDQDGIDPDNVIMSPDRARSRGLTSTVCFPVGNLAPEGSVIKATSIDPTLIDADGKFHHLGPAKVFTTEEAAIHAIKTSQIVENDVMVLICCGPAGAGMQEIYQITSALKALPFGKHVAVLTDARFSGVSTGACIGHISPEALAGGALGKLRDGDQIEILIDRKNLTGTVDFVGTSNGTMSPEDRRSISRRARPPPRPRTTPRTPRRHPPLGRSRPRQRRHLGRLRLRRRRHHHSPQPGRRSERTSRIHHPTHHINSYGERLIP